LVISYWLLVIIDTAHNSSLTNHRSPQAASRILHAHQFVNEVSDIFPGDPKVFLPAFKCFVRYLFLIDGFSFELHFNMTDNQKKTHQHPVDSLKGVAAFGFFTFISVVYQTL